MTVRVLLHLRRRRPDVDIGAWSASTGRMAAGHRHRGAAAQAVMALQMAGYASRAASPKPRRWRLINGGFFVLSPRDRAHRRRRHRLGGRPGQPGRRRRTLALAAELWQAHGHAARENLLEELWQSGRAPWKRWTSRAMAERAVAFGRVLARAGVLLTGHTGFKGLAGLVAASPGRAGDRAGAAAAHRPQPVRVGRRGDRPDAPAVRCARRRGAARRGATPRPEVVLHLAADPWCGRRTRSRWNLVDQRRGHSPSAGGAARRRGPARGRGGHHRQGLQPRDPASAGRWARRARSPTAPTKAATELVVAGWRDAFLRERGVAVASARAGNVIGGGDWAAERLLPDALRAWRADMVELVLRHPQAVRPWQHVLEPLAGYLRLAEVLWRRPRGRRPAASVPATGRGERGAAGGDGAARLQPHPRRQSGAGQCAARGRPAGAGQPRLAARPGRAARWRVGRRWRAPWTGTGGWMPAGLPPPCARPIWTPTRPAHARA